MKTRVLFWTTTAALMFFSGLASAAVPLELPVQGVLRDNAGLPVAEDVFEMTFALYDGPDAVAPVWTEARVPADGESCVTTPEACVHVTGGVFHVNLGSGEPLGLEILKANPGLWLGVTVETDPELPRRPLGSAPYARHAQDAASASSVSCSGCLEVEMLSDGARETLTQAALTAVEEAGFAKQADLVVGEGNLPGNGLNEVSNGLLSNEFVHTFSLEAPVDIKDDFPPGVSTSIVVPNVGIAQYLRVSIDITNSDLSTLSVKLFDADGEPHLLWDESGPGEHLVATYPAPDTAVSGDLSTWVGRNPAGTWFLEVIDDGFKDQGLDGEIAAWSIEIDTLSNQQVAVQGDLVVQGAISGPGGITVGSGTAPCDPAHAGSISFDTETQRLNLCTGTELLQLKACSTQCNTPEAVLCGATITDGCDTPCEGTGTALNTTQCLVVAGTAGCGQPVTDECGNDCGLVGSSSDPAACPDTGTTPCSVAVLDPCGNACGTQGTGLNEALCAIPSNVACGVATTDPCGNDCSEQGTQCANKGLCVEGGCLLYGSGASNPGLSCADILATRPGVSDGVYWIDPDGVGGDGSFEAYCDMTLDGGGWTLILNLDSDDGVRHDYTDETFWLTSNTEGQASEGLQHGFKGKAYQTPLPAESDLMILAHSESLTVGYATYTLLSEVQNESLLTMMSTFTDQTVSTGAIVQAGSVGAAHGDLFLEHPGALVINDASGWNAALTQNRISTTHSPGGSGHRYAGLGGQHRQAGWGVRYESAPITTYCTPDHYYGDLSNYAPHPDEGNMPYTDCGNSAGNALSIDMAIFFR